MQRANQIGKRQIAIALLLCVAFIAMLGIGNVAAANPTVVTNAATNVGDTNAILNGNVTVMGSGNTKVKFGFQWGTSATLATFSNITVGSTTSAPKAYATEVSTQVKTKYYFRAWARNFTGDVDRSQWAVGSILNFTTTDVTGDSIRATTSLISVLLVALIPIIVMIALFGFIMGIFTGEKGMFKKVIRPKG